MWLEVTILISSPHFIPYASELAEKVEWEMERAEAAPELIATCAED
jgi:hypothetical protein